MVGQECTFHFLDRGPFAPSGPFHQERQVICSFSIALRSSAALVSLLTPSRTNGLSASRLTRARSCGYRSRLEALQFPQKSITVTFPRYSLSFIFFPSGSTPSFWCAVLPIA